MLIFCSFVLSGRQTNYGFGVVFFDKAVEGHLLRMMAFIALFILFSVSISEVFPDFKLLSIVRELFLQFGGLN